MLILWGLPQINYCVGNTVILRPRMGNFDDRKGQEILSSLSEGQIVIVHYHQKDTVTPSFISQL